MNDSQSSTGLINTSQESGQTDEDRMMISQMEKMVDSYDGYMRKITFGRERLLREKTVKLAQVKAGDSVLEIGCGTGSLTLEAKRQAGQTGKVTGIDIIPGMVEASRRKAELAGQEINFQTGSISEIPFTDNMFNSVMCSFMIFHMSESTRNKGFQEIQRVLKPQGRLLIVDLALPQAGLSRFIAKTLLGFMIEHELEELLPVLTKNGFSELKIMPVQFRILGLSVISSLTGIVQK